MGRKNRIQTETKEHLSSDSEDEDNTENIEKQNNIKELDVIWNARLKMIEYCDEMAIPLCDYLSQDVMDNFVKFLNES